ncbi:hypothetical protein RE428_33110 [Marinobacter nanhaiticus D15-8W]|nr:hypothetical protein RE428_33110 [Marinobacter nanhaiticus D15-8W]
MDWKREIGIAHLIKQKIAEVDEERLWEHCYPEMAASPRAIEDAEAPIGIKARPSSQGFSGSR